MSPRRLLKICLPTAALLIAATTVWGFWSTQGAGTASATVGTLNPPTNVSVVACAQMPWSGLPAPSVTVPVI